MTVASVVITKRQKMREIIERILKVVISFQSLGFGRSTISSSFGSESTSSKSRFKYSFSQLTGVSISELTLVKSECHLDFFRFTRKYQTLNWYLMFAMQSCDTSYPRSRSRTKFELWLIAAPSRSFLGSSFSRMSMQAVLLPVRLFAIMFRHWLTIMQKSATASLYSFLTFSARLSSR